MSWRPSVCPHFQTDEPLNQYRLALAFAVLIHNVHLKQMKMQIQEKTFNLLGCCVYMIKVKLLELAISTIISQLDPNDFFMPPKELWEAYSNRTVRPSVCPSRFRVRSISPIFFEVGIPNLVCGYILGWGSVAYHFWVTVTLTLTSDLDFRIIVSGAYLLYDLR